MRSITLGIVIGLIFLLSACSNGVQEATGEPTESGSATPTAPSLTAVPPREEGYPPPGPDSGSPGPAEQGAYPAPLESEPTNNPYPGGVAVIEHPAGTQCADPLYPDLKSATDALEEAGVTILESEEFELMVCEACDCPTSLHYRIHIDSADLETALSLGWQRGS